MAFPTVPTAASGDLLSSATTTASQTHTFPNLSSLRGGAGPQAGDLLIAICVQYQGGTANAEFGTWGASFTETADDATTTALDLAVGVAHKIAAGTESGTFTVTSAHSFMSAQFLMRIPKATWSGATIPEVLSPAVRATGAVADPGSFDPATWGTEDTLWISVYGHSETTTTGSPPAITTPPTNYTGELIVARGADAVGNITAAVAFRQVNASAEDVGTWTVSNAIRGNGLATVIAVRPMLTETPTPGGATGGGAAPTVKVAASLVGTAAAGTTIESTGTARISLASGDTPATRNSHAIKIRARVQSGTGIFHAQLFEGTTARTPALSQDLTTTLTEYPLAISDSDAANIGSYSNLEIRIWGTSPTAVTFELDQLWLEVPAGTGGATSETPTPGGATAAGAAPGAAASLAIGGATAAGPAPTIRAAVPQGGAVASGVGPSESTSTSETPTPGGATTGGPAPTAKVATPQGGAPAAGPAPSTGIAVSPGGGAAAGASPTTAKASLTISGGVAGGVGPQEGGPTTETPAPGGAVAGGVAPVAKVATVPEAPVAQGGLGMLWLHGLPQAAGGAQPAARASLAIGGGTAGGPAPTETTPTQTGTAKISLASGAAPATRTAHSIKLRARTTAGAGKIRVALYEGATNRTGGVGYLESAALTTSLADYSLALTDAAAASISSYANLDVWIWGFAASGGAIVFEVDQLWLEIPASGAGSETPTPGGAVGGGASPTARAASATGGATAAGVAATARASAPQGGAVAGGVAPGEQITGGDLVPLGGAVASGTTPTARVSETIAGAIANGAAPTVRSSTTLVGTAATGVAPSGAQAGITIGGAVAGGRAPGEQITGGDLVPSGGAVAGGAAPAARVVLTIGGASSGGFAPTQSFGNLVTIGGAVAGGVSPTVKASATRGGATAGGPAPLAYAFQIPVLGGAIAGGRAPTGAIVTLTIDGAVAGGFPAGVPLLLTQGVRVGFVGRTSGTIITSGRNGKIDDVELTPR